MTTENRHATTTAQVINRIRNDEILNRDEMAQAFQPVLEQRFRGADVAWGALFAALHTRGPTSAELLGLTDAILAFDPQLAGYLSNKRVLDTESAVVAVAGSGKESFKTFNVSTAAALVASSHPDVCVIKPAGPATSAVTGATDVLHALDLRVPTTLTQVSRMAEGAGFGVVDYHLVAPRYGPRYEGLFHHLHPLSHVNPWFFLPFHIDGLVFGVAEPPVELAASVMASVAPAKSAAVVTTRVGAHGWIDEMAPFGRIDMAVLKEGRLRVDSRRLPLPSSLDGIAQHGHHRANAALLTDIVRGKGPVLARELVAANAGLLLRVGGIVEDEDKANELAIDLIRSGDTARQLDRCVAASQDER